MANTKKKDEDLLILARKRFEIGETYEQENREEGRVDLEFLCGDQWTQEAIENRKGRPMLTINRMPQFVRQVVGDIKQSRPSIKVHPVDSDADPKIAELYQGLIRNIEVLSDAKEAYFNASENQVAAGEGYWRVITDYATDDAFDQDVLIEKIPSPFAVTMDPMSNKMTGEDAKWAFVTERMSKEEFKQAYPKASDTNFDAGKNVSSMHRWLDGDSIRIAEYWYSEDETQLLAQLEDGSVIDITDIEQPPEIGIVKTRKAVKRCWYRAVINGAEVLEKPQKWPGAFLPIVRVVGEQVNLGEKVIRHGVIRHARDAQRMYNYWRSAQTEMVALQPKAPYILDPKGIVGYEEYWNQANSANIPWLPFDFTAAGGSKPFRESPPVGSSGMGQEIALAAEDMKATTGIYDASLGNRSNETSGKAILARQKESDVGTYTYFDNLTRAIQYTGRILIDLIPHVYDNERVVRVLGEDESEEMVRINTVLPTGEVVNDLTVGKYDVTVAMGPAYSTKRQEAADGMLMAIQGNPQLWGIIGDLLAKNLDWPGAEEMAERMQKMLPPELKPKPDENDPDAMQQMQAAAQAQQQQSQLQKMQIRMQMAEMKAKIDKLNAEVAEKAANTMETAVDTEGQKIENIAAQMNLAAANGDLERVIDARVKMQVMDLIQQANQPPMGVQ